MANVTLKMNTEDIFQINTSTAAIHEDINGYLNSINNECLNIGNNIKSANVGIHSKLVYVEELISKIKSSLDSNFDVLTKFLSTQMKSYEESAIEATKLLREALDFIDENFNTRN